MMLINVVADDNIGFPGQIREFFNSNSFSLHSNSTILVHCRISAVQIHYSGFQIYGFFIRINIFFIQIH